MSERLQDGFCQTCGKHWPVVVLAVECCSPERRKRQEKR